MKSTSLWPPERTSRRYRNKKSKIKSTRNLSSKGSSSIWRIRIRVFRNRTPVSERSRRLWRSSMRLVVSRNSFDLCRRARKKRIILTSQGCRAKISMQPWTFKTIMKRLKPLTQQPQLPVPKLMVLIWTCPNNWVVLDLTIDRLNLCRICFRTTRVELSNF